MKVVATDSRDRLISEPHYAFKQSPNLLSYYSQP